MHKGAGGGVKSVIRELKMTVNNKETLKTFVPIKSKNSASAQFDCTYTTVRAFKAKIIQNYSF